jgi:hypothetical protein
MMVQIHASIDPIDMWLKQRPTLQLSPVYQRRGSLWKPDAKALLIDSILNGYDIPKFYVADLAHIDPFEHSLVGLEKGAPARYAVIDGRQRFESIFDFYDGRLRLSSAFVLEESPLIPLAGLSYPDLVERHPELATRFLRFGLAVMRIVTDDEARITSLFVRLNSSTPLTGAEKRNAMEGEAPRIIRTLASHRFFAEHIRFQIRRGQDWNVAAKLLLIESLGHFADTKRAQLDRFVAEAARADLELFDLHRARQRVERVLDAMCDIFEPRDALLRSEGPVTLYYWFVRALPEDPSRQIRGFLVAFDEAIQETRRLMRSEREALVDPSLALYIDLSRSINDQGSLERRFQIMFEAYGAFLQNDFPGHWMQHVVER